MNGRTASPRSLVGMRAMKIQQDVPRCNTCKWLYLQIADEFDPMKEEGECHVWPPRDSKGEFPTAYFHEYCSLHEPAPESIDWQEVFYAEYAEDRLEEIEERDSGKE